MNPFRCVRCSEPVLFFGLNRISGTDKAHCLPFLQASNPSCPVHNHKGCMNNFFRKTKERHLRARTSAALTPEPSRATSVQQAHFERIRDCNIADTHKELQT
ncbi:hypothetical protein HanPI659440_Chr09g0353911 [Helianthus annuus]|nr:hypothetical protein HanPI659440_Chr09g0353911 [Helianthus annuus]